MSKLTGKIAVVTGVTGGLGQIVAQSVLVKLTFLVKESRRATC